MAMQQFAALEAHAHALAAPTSCWSVLCPAGLLWSLAPRLAFFLIFYAVGGTWITAAGFGQRLMALTYSVLQREADLRFSLVRWWCCCPLPLPLCTVGALPSQAGLPLTSTVPLIGRPCVIPPLPLRPPPPPHTHTHHLPICGAGAGAGECRVNCLLQRRPAGG